MHVESMSKLFDDCVSIERKIRSVMRKDKVHCLKRNAKMSKNSKKIVKIRETAQCKLRDLRKFITSTYTYACHHYLQFFASILHRRISKVDSPSNISI